MGARCQAVTASILCALAVVPAATAGEVDRSVCAFVLYQERDDLKESELAVDIAESHLVAAKSIFDVTDALWKQDLTERFRYLTDKHRKDVAVLDVTRQELLLERQEAFVEQLEILCSSPDKQDDAGREAAHRRYVQADCQRIEKDLAIAEIDLVYLSEFLANVRDLRENDVATHEQVALAEADVEKTRKRVEHHASRVQACIDSGAAAGQPD
jgi:hypothetical protein